MCQPGPGHLIEGTAEMDCAVRYRRPDDGFEGIDLAHRHQVGHLGRALVVAFQPITDENVETRAIQRCQS